MYQRSQGSLEVVIAVMSKFCYQQMSAAASTLMNVVIQKKYTTDQARLVNWKNVIYERGWRWCSHPHRGEGIMAKGHNIHFSLPCSG